MLLTTPACCNDMHTGESHTDTKCRCRCRICMSGIYVIVTPPPNHVYADARVAISAGVSGERAGGKPPIIRDKT